MFHYKPNYQYSAIIQQTLAVINSANTDAFKSNFPLCTVPIIEISDLGFLATGNSQLHPEALELK